MFLSRSIFRAKAELDKIKERRIEKRAAGGTRRRGAKADHKNDSSLSVKSGVTTSSKISKTHVPIEIKVKNADDTVSACSRSTSLSRMKKLEFHTITQLFESWELVRNSIGNDWEYVVGGKVLLNLFHIEPRTKALFGVCEATDVTEDILMENTLTKTHVALLIQTVDSMLSMLGPTCESIEELIYDLAKRHSRKGVKTLFIPFMGRAIVNCLADILGEYWRPSYADAWEDFMDSVGENFMKVMVAEQE